MQQHDVPDTLKSKFADPETSFLDAVSEYQRWAVTGLTGSNSSGLAQGRQQQEAAAQLRQEAREVCSNGGCSASTGLLKCSKCKCFSFCGQKCMTEAWSLHKRECKPLSAARSLPAEPAPISFYDATGGWKLGFYRGESRSFVWVLRNFAYDGPESDRHVLLGGKELVRKDAQLTRQDAVLALCNAMLTPRISAMACFGPRRPAAVVIDNSIPAEVQKALAPVVLALGIPNVECKCLGSADDAGDPYLDFWFRVEAEEALDKTSEIFKKIGEERCHPMPPDPVEPDSSQSMSPEMRREAKAWLEWDKQITDRDMKSVPQGAKVSVMEQFAYMTSGRDLSAVMDIWYAGVHDNWLYIYEPKTTPQGVQHLVIHHFRPVRSKSEGGIAVQSLVGAMKQGAVSARLRPGLLIPGNPSICNLVGVKEFEVALGKLGIDVNLPGQNAIESALASYIPALEQRGYFRTEEVRARNEWVQQQLAAAAPPAST